MISRNQFVRLFIKSILFLVLLCVLFSVIIHSKFGAFMVASKGTSAQLTSMIRNGLDVNTRESFGNSTLLMQSVGIGREDNVQLLLENHADVNLQNSFGNTALILAASRGNNEILLMLLKAGADVSIENKRGKTALSAAQHESHIQTIAILKKYGAK